MLQCYASYASSCSQEEAEIGVKKKKNELILLFGRSERIFICASFTKLLVEIVFHLNSARTVLAHIKTIKTLAIVFYTAGQSLQLLIPSSFVTRIFKAIEKLKYTHRSIYIFHDHDILTWYKYVSLAIHLLLKSPKPQKLLRKNNICIVRWSYNLWNRTNISINLTKKLKKKDRAKYKSALLL